MTTEDKPLLQLSSDIDSIRDTIERLELDHARSVSDEMMDLVDRLGSEAPQVDPRVWQALAVYMPPIPMILHCPSCHAQHIDAPTGEHAAICNISCGMNAQGCSCGKWNNPPHRSHLCHNCKTVWRPADVATTGVEKIQTKGEHDSARRLLMFSKFKVWRAYRRAQADTVPQLNYLRRLRNSSLCLVSITYRGEGHEDGLTPFEIQTILRKELERLSK